MNSACLASPDDTLHFLDGQESVSKTGDLVAIQAFVLSGAKNASDYESSTMIMNDETSFSLVKSTPGCFNSDMFMH